MAGFATRCRYCFKNMSWLRFKYVVMTYSLLIYMMLLHLLDCFMNHQFKKEKRDENIYLIF